jgi:hypothetical protein
MGGQWWRIELGPDEPIGPLQSEFVALFQERGEPEGAALFCDVLGFSSTVIFFSPGAAAIAGAMLLRYGGRLCEPPSAGIFVAGHEGNRALLLKHPTWQ